MDNRTQYEIESRIDYPGQIQDLEARREKMREELEKMANDRDALRELMRQKNQFRIYLRRGSRTPLTLHVRRHRVHRCHEGDAIWL